MKKCIGCGHYTSRVLNLGMLPISNQFTDLKNSKNIKKYQLGLNFCTKCYLVQNSKIINNKEIFNNNYLYYSSYSKSWLDHCKKLTNYIIQKFKLNKNSEVMEIASNDGYLLQYFKKKNIRRCYGVEPSLSVAKIAKHKGIQTYVNFFNLNFIKKNHNKIKPNVIIALNVLAHTPNLSSFIKSLSLIMNNNTICIAEFPYLLNLVKKKQIDTIYHEHYSYFSLTSINNILSMHNLSIVNFDFVNTHGGSLRVTIKKTHKKNKISQKINKLLLKEKRLGFKKINFFQNFSSSINILLKKNTLKLNKIFLNHKVIGYGAAAKSTIMCNLLKLDKNKIEFICDSNKYKQKKYIPGTNIKIIDPARLKKLKPDFILIFAWNLKKEIMEIVKNKINANLKFITLEPWLKIKKC